jgi:hypothetical protein
MIKKNLLIIGEKFGSPNYISTFGTNKSVLFINRDKKKIFLENKYKNIF